MPYRIHSDLLFGTFEQLRRCGEGRRECQALWISPWDDVENIDKLIHPRHSASSVGFDVEGQWIDKFWDQLAATKHGIRVQIHTHPGAAYHSSTDDAYPIIHRPGFLSLVIPSFAMGAVSFDGAYLAEMQEGGSWKQVPIEKRLEVV